MDNNNVVLVCVFMGHMCVLQPGICYYMTIVIEELKTNKMALIWTKSRTKSASVVPSISCVHFTPSAMLGNPVNNWIILISLSHRKVETYSHDLESQERSYKLRKRADTCKPMSNNLLILDTITIYLTHKNNFLHKNLMLHFVSQIWKYLGCDQCFVAHHLAVHSVPQWSV